MMEIKKFVELMTGEFDNKGFKLAYASPNSFIILTYIMLA